MGKTTEDSKNYTLTELREVDRPLYIKNLTPLLWTLHEGNSGNRVDIELKPAGREDSITFLPKDALDHPAISRNIAKGKIAVSPDFEDEMVDLATGTRSPLSNLLDEYKVSVQESPADRAIDGKGKLDELMAGVERKRITPQGLQSAGGGSVLDDFISPKPFRAEDGRIYDPRTGEFLSDADATALGDGDVGIKSIQVTAPASLKNKEN